MNIAALLQQQARLRPEAAAIVDTHRGRRRVTTYAQLERLARQAAQLLHLQGLRPGDGVLIFVGMSAELYALLSAVFGMGLVAMFLDPSAGKAHLERCCQIMPPRVFVGSTKAHLLRLWCPALRRIPVKVSIGWPVPGAHWWSRIERLTPHDEIAPTGPDTPALMTFTSGSTGLPKAAVRTHGFLAAQHGALVDTIDLKPGEVDLATLPIFALANLASGLTTVIPNADLRAPGRIDAGPVVEQIRRDRPVRSVASPAFFARLLAHCREHGVTLESLRRIYTGGAPVFPALMDDLKLVAPQAEVVAVYGSTEAEPISHVAHHEIGGADLAAMHGGEGLLAGQVVGCVRLRILQDRWGTPLSPMSAAEFDALRQPAGADGEIVVTGEHVLKGYWQGVGDEQTKFKVDGEVWHRTGDAGRLDARGRLWLLGRCEAKIATKAGPLYPFAVECALSRLPQVGRSALVQLRSRKVLAVEPRGPGAVSAEQIRAAIAWAPLDEVRLVERIPVDKRHNAKVDYPALRRMLG